MTRLPLDTAPVSDTQLVIHLLAVQNALSEIQDAAPVHRQLVIDGVLIAVDVALTGLGYEPPPECRDGEPAGPAA
jgi:hypothetical protein